MSVSKRIKYFKQLAILLTIFWSLLTTCFVAYQFYNEEKHIEQNTIEKVKGIADQSVAFLYWTCAQQAQSSHDDKTLPMASLKELLASQAKQNDITFDLSLLEKEINTTKLQPMLKNALSQTKERQKDGFILFKRDGEKNLFYVTPLFANATCVSCHMHAQKKVGDLMGYATLQTKIPPFKEESPQTFYFLVVTYLGTWLLGLFAIWWIHARGRNYLNEKTKMYEESMYALIDMMEKRDSYTAGHSQRVAEYAKILVLEMGYSNDDADFIYKAGMLHDIGKIEIPDAILLKPDKLTDMEYTLIKRHARASYELLSREPFSLLAPIVLHHHEHYDGGGYPDGLKEDFIPLFSQVIGVADAFDAMTTNRAYRKSLSKEEAIAILHEERGKQFNPRIVDVAQTVFSKITLPEDTTQMPKDLLEEMRFSYYFRDQLTGFYNVNYLKFIFNHASNYALKIFQIDHLNCTDFALFNKEHGWKKGDQFLCLIAQTIASIYPDAIVVRVYSDNFLVLHVKENEVIDYSKIDHLMSKNALVMQYQHIQLSVDEPLTLEVLEDKLLHL